eukprot:TRINITY_DN57300_c0_g2_i1.p1 TRINITY_DN57300_c0_g2~~TRINITY_DN57300_c0_g2_i1.p1  ORF type:complete len:607 (+),score=80.57 TRINITY_DN57300_c0_g2_i1:154-1821(+)
MGYDDYYRDRNGNGPYHAAFVRPMPTGWPFIMHTVYPIEPCAPPPPQPQPHPQQIQQHQRTPPSSPPPTMAETVPPAPSASRAVLAAHHSPPRDQQQSPHYQFQQQSLNNSVQREDWSQQHDQTVNGSQEWTRASSPASHTLNQSHHSHASPHNNNSTTVHSRTMHHHDERSFTTTTHHHTSSRMSSPTLDNVSPISDRFGDIAHTPPRGRPPHGTQQNRENPLPVGAPFSSTTEYRAEYQQRWSPEHFDDSRQHSPPAGYMFQNQEDQYMESHYGGETSSSNGECNGPNDNRFEEDTARVKHEMVTLKAQMQQVLETHHSSTALATQGEEVHRQVVALSEGSSQRLHRLQQEFAVKQQAGELTADEVQAMDEHAQLELELTDLAQKVREKISMSQHPTRDSQQQPNSHPAMGPLDSSASSISPPFQGRRIPRSVQFVPLDTTDTHRNVEHDHPDQPPSPRPTRSSPPTEGEWSAGGGSGNGGVVNDMSPVGSDDNFGEIVHTPPRGKSARANTCSPDNPLKPVGLEVSFNAQTEYHAEYSGQWQTETHDGVGGD